MKKKKERKYSSAKTWAKNASTGTGKSYLKIPEKMELFKPKAGSMLLDILPYTVGKGNPNADEGVLHFERTFFVHRGVGVNNDWYICPARTAEKPCPICEYRARKSDGTNDELIRQLAPAKRQLYIVKNLKEPEKGFQLWDISYHLFGDVLGFRLLEADEEDEWDKFFHITPGEGLTLRVAFAEENFQGNSFSKTGSIDFKPRKRHYTEEEIEDLPCLDDLLIIPDYDELKKAFLMKQDEEDEEDDDIPYHENKKKAKKSRPAEEDDEDEDDDEETPPPKKKPRAAKEDDEDEDDEEEVPAAKKKAKPKAKEDWGDFDEDDEEEDDDDDDEEDKAKPSKKSKKPAVDEEDDQEDGDDPDEDEDDDDDVDDEDEDEPAPKKKVKPAAKSKKPAKDDDWEDEEDDEDEDEEDDEDEDE